MTLSVCGKRDDPGCDKRQRMPAPESLKRNLRQYFDCPCQGESFGSGGFQDLGEDWKAGEAMQRQVETLTGVKPKGCPWYALQVDPFVKEVLRIFNLANDYPHYFNDELPNAIWEGVVYYRTALQRARNWWIDKDEEDREAEAKKSSASAKFGPPRRSF